MTSRLYDYRAKGYSQFGEEGMIAECLRRFGAVWNLDKAQQAQPVCMEFGAGDGLEDSNTAHLWRDLGWRGLLIEADPGRAKALFANTADLPDVGTIQTKVTDIDRLLYNLEWPVPDVLSIDVDGDDYLIWERSDVRPSLVVIEYNPSVPPRVDVRPAAEGSLFGASARALCRLAAVKGYALVGLTESNLFFVRDDLASGFNDLETDLDALMAPFAFVVVATDYIGRPLLLIDPNRLYWGFRGFEDPVKEPLIFGH